MSSMLLKILESVMRLSKATSSLVAAEVESGIRDLVFQAPADAFVDSVMELADGVIVPVVFDVSGIPETRRHYYRQLLSAGQVKPVGFQTLPLVEQPVKLHTCPTCGKMFDPRDLNQVIAHQHTGILHTAVYVQPGVQVGPCYQCAHSGRCAELLGVSYDPKGTCDWSPSRFQERVSDGQGQGQAAQAGEASEASAGNVHNEGSAGPDTEVS